MLTPYEDKQNYNAITNKLHTTRYVNLVKFIEQVSKNTSQKPLKIVDIGCGPAKSFSVLNDHFDIEYIGIELREDFCAIANERYSSLENFNVICDSIENHYEKFNDADVVIGLESFEHIPENLVVRVIEAIATRKVPYFYCTVPNEIGAAILIKNVGSAMMGYMRHKEYTWRETFYSSIYNLDKVKVHDVGHKGFDWRWLAQTIRQNMKIDYITTSPFRFMPRVISPSIGFMCSARED